MDYFIDKKIQFNSDSEHKSLYQWSLNEVGGGFNQNQQIPWDWGFYFTVNALSVCRTISIETPRNGAKEVRNTSRISGVMYSGNCRDGGELSDYVAFSMFGTERLIKNFQLSIYEVDSDEEEACSIWGCPSYQTEIDFEYFTTNDDVVVHVGLKGSKFTDLVKLIDAKQIDSALIRLNQVSGFYSDWSPSIKTNHVKILTEMHKVEGLDGSDIKPPTLGSVGDIDIYLNTVNNLNAKLNLNAKNFYQQFEEIIEHKEESLFQQVGFKPPIPDEGASRTQEIAYYTKLIASLKSPLWLIFIVLILILLK